MRPGGGGGGGAGRLVGGGVGLLVGGPGQRLVGCPAVRAVVGRCCACIFNTRRSGAPWPSPAGLQGRGGGICTNKEENNRTATITPAPPEGAASGTPDLDKLPRWAGKWEEEKNSTRRGSRPTPSQRTTPRQAPQRHGRDQQRPAGPAAAHHPAQRRHPAVGARGRLPTEGAPVSSGPVGAGRSPAGAAGRARRGGPAWARRGPRGPAGHPARPTHTRRKAQAIKKKCACIPGQPETMAWGRLWGLLPGTMAWGRLPLPKRGALPERGTPPEQRGR